MSLGAAWILFGAVIAGCGEIAHSDGSAQFAGFMIALMATAFSKAGKQYFWRKKD